MDPEELAELKDRNGISLREATAAYGIDLLKAREAGQQLRHAAAYLELHIEQGPVLEDLDLPLGVVIGTYGVERYSITFTGQAAHAGSTPMPKRRDAFAAAAKLGLEIRDIATRNGGVCTVGSCITKPGIVTAVVGECTITLDQRHMDAAGLAQMLSEAQAASRRFAAEEKCEVAWNRIWQIVPIPFNPELIELCDQAIRETAGQVHRLPSGPLHDAAEICRAGVPTIMMFVQSLRGISHNKIEDTREEHIELSVIAFDRLASKAIEWIQR
jgi:N-carbamoyl-L-amino-acid hydrolase